MNAKMGKLSASTLAAVFVGVAFAGGGGDKAIAMGDLPAEITAYYCLAVDKDDKNVWWTKEDNWAKVEFMIRETDSSSWVQIEEIHTANDSNRGAFKCRQVTYDTPSADATVNGKAVVANGKDYTFNSRQAGSFCFTAEYDHSQLTWGWHIKRFAAGGSC